jgi:hypothetical protein
VDTPIRTSFDCDKFGMLLLCHTLTRNKNFFCDFRGVTVVSISFLNRPWGDHHGRYPFNPTLLDVAISDLPKSVAPLLGPLTFPFSAFRTEIVHDPAILYLCKKRPYAGKL